jgi:hypothetical protein
VDFSECSSGQNYNYSVQLIDASGAVSTLPTQNYTNVMYYPPGTSFWELPKVCFNTIKIPLTDFTGVDLTQIQKVKFLYDQETAGSIYITELSLSERTPLTTSIAHNYPASVAAIYPNPANESIYVKLGSEYQSITSIRIFDIQGKLVYQTRNISELLNIDLQGLEKGIYILNITSTRDSRNYKIVKQ